MEEVIQGQQSETPNVLIKQVSCTRLIKHKMRGKQKIENGQEKGMQLDMLRMHITYEEDKIDNLDSGCSFFFFLVSPNV